MKKNTLKKALAAAVSAVLCLSLAACAAKPAPASSGAASSGAAPETLRVGVLQFAPHPSLDNCYTGIVQGLADAGYTEGDNLVIDFQNSLGSVSDGDLMAKTMLSSGCNLIIGIATPSAMSCYSAAKDAGVPVIYSAVSDPVGSGLALDLTNPQTGASGTKDALNLEGQLKMIRAFLPDAKTIGILYTTSEPNSISHLADFEALAPQYGFSVEAVGITNEAEVATGAAALVSKGVDCVNNFTDNNVVNNLSVLLHATDAAGIPVFGSEVEQVKNGCVASESLDYVALGVETGRLAAAVLDGSDVNTLPVSVVANSAPVYSQTNCDKFGVTVPADYAQAENIDG